jgi:hypothetical protein
MMLLQLLVKICKGEISRRVKKSTAPFCVAGAIPFRVLVEILALT